MIKAVRITPYTLLGFLALTWLLIGLTFSHKSTAGTPIILQSDSYSLSIGKNVSIFEDPNGTMSFEEISHRDNQPYFSKIHTQYLKIGPTDSAIWLRISLYNPLSSHQITVVTFSNPHVDDIEPYHLSFSDQQNGHSSIKRINSSHRQSQAFILDIEPQSVESFLFRVETDAFLNTSIELKSLDQYVKKDNFTNLVAGLIFGLVLASMIFYVRIYMRHPNPFVLMAILYSVSVMFGLISGLGMLISYWELDRDSSRLVESIAHATALLIYIITVWKFNWQGKLTRLIMKLLITAQASIIALSFLMPASLLEMAIHGGGLVSSLIVLAILLVRKSEHKEFHPAFTLGAFGFAVSTAIILINAHNIVSIDSLTIWIMILLPLIGLILFFVMAYQINRKESALAANADKEYDSSLLNYIAKELKLSAEDITHIYELVSNTPLSMKQRDYISKISLSNRNIDVIVQRLDNLVKINKKQLQLSEDTFQIDDLLNDTVAEFQPEAKQKQVELVVDISRIPTSFLVGDFFRVKLILHDLIEQVLKPIEKGDIYLSAEYNEEGRGGISLQIQFRGRTLHHKEMNDGLSFILNPLEFNPKHWGAYVTHHLIKHMRGKVSLEYHTPRNGSLNLFLPFALSNQINFEMSQTQIQELTDKKALVLAGNSALRGVLESRLKLWMMQCHSTFSEKEALAMLRNQSGMQQPYDIIIIDQDTPNLSEYQLLEKIQLDQELALKPKTILLTGMGTTGIEKPIQDVGFDAVLDKPVSNEYLLETLIKFV